MFIGELTWNIRVYLSFLSFSFTSVRYSALPIEGMFNLNLLLSETSKSKSRLLMRLYITFEVNESS